MLAASPIASSATLDARLIPAIQREQREVAVRRERARAEEALRRSEAQYRSLVDGAVVAEGKVDIGAVRQALARTPRPKP